MTEQQQGEQQDVPEQPEQQDERAHPLAIPDQVRGYLEASRGELSRLLAERIPVDRFINVAYDVSRSPRLREAYFPSILRAIWDAANLGLEPSGILGEGYIVTRWNKTIRMQEAQFQPGYRGLAALARRGGKITAIDWGVVYDCDRFAWTEGTSPSVDHVPARERPATAVITHSYAWARDRNGQIYLVVMTRDEIEHVRSKSPAKDDGPWVTDWPEMAKKSAVRRLAKKLPLDPVMQRAIALDDAVEIAEVNVTPVDGAEQQPQTSKDRLRAALAQPAAPAQVETAEQPAEQAEQPQEPPQAAEAVLPMPPPRPEPDPDPVPDGGPATVASAPEPESEPESHRAERWSAVLNDECDHPGSDRSVLQAGEDGAPVAGIYCNKCRSLLAYLHTGEKAEPAQDVEKPPKQEKPKRKTRSRTPPPGVSEWDVEWPAEPQIVPMVDPEYGRVTATLSTGGRAQVVAPVEVLEGIEPGGAVHISGRLEMVAWEKDGVAMPPFRRIHVDDLS